MKKFKLNLDELKVESFNTTSDQQKKRGTVVGNFHTQQIDPCTLTTATTATTDDPDTGDGNASGNYTCNGGYTCGGYTCDASCPVEACSGSTGEVSCNAIHPGDTCN